ncbi:MAG: putative porin [Acidobacteria bacterium]|nr:putative porin [Acidobacteriota bacterium]
MENQRIGRKSAGLRKTAQAGLWMLLISVPLQAQLDGVRSDARPPWPSPSSASSLSSQESNEMDRVEKLEGMIRRQQEQIETLRLALAEQGRTLEQIRQSFRDKPVAAAPLPSAPAQTVLVATVAPGLSQGSLAAAPSPSSLQESAEVERLEKKINDLEKALGGFRLSGDFRFRLDAQLRSGNALAAPLQNVRSRYRFRLNLDKDLEERFRFHAQLSTGPLNNAITNDQDMAGIVAKHLFSIAEAHIEFRPNPHFSLLGGRMPETFADNMRFLWDDDVRFNGFAQRAAFPLDSSFLGFQQLELRVGEYFLSNPNIAVLPASSPFVGAGFPAGKKVRDAMLFHPGFLLRGTPATGWQQQIVGDIQIYRNPNQIQLASTPEGVPGLVSNTVGVALASPLGGTGNATTAPGGSTYWAANYLIFRLAYRLEREHLPLFGGQIPAWLDLQVARNVGTSRLRDAFMVSLNLGEVRGAGETRFLYQFAIKDANALVSQFTDDDLGTGSGVNIAVHGLRFDLGLAKFLQWQNLLFIQTERRPSNPRELFFVPLQRGTNPTFRYLGQLAFSF